MNYKSLSRHCFLNCLSKQPLDNTLRKQLKIYIINQKSVGSAQVKKLKVKAAINTLKSNIARSETIQFNL